MSCTQKQQLVCFPKVRVYKPWFRHFNDHKDFRNEGTVHLFSLMALFSYANFRSNERVINGDRYMEAPGQWICKLGALPRILRVHSKAQALELMEYFQNHGFLTFEILDEEKEILRFTIADWKEHCTHLQYNYYSYKGSGFFFFPLPVGRLLLKIARKEVGIVFSELDAIMDMWLHTILNDPKVRGSEYMPVVYYSNMRGICKRKSDMTNHTPCLLDEAATFMKVQHLSYLRFLSTDGRSRLAAFLETFDAAEYTLFQWNDPLNT